MRWLAVLGASMLLAACAGDDGATTPSPTALASTATAAATSTTSPSSSTSTSTTTASTTTTAAATTTTVPLGASIGDLLDLGRPVVLAHTGGEDAYPGSTMYAFAKSVADGVDVLDFNVLLSSDGVLVVQHDETVDRQTNAAGDVATMTFDQLHALDNAYWFADGGVDHERPAADYIYRGVRTGAEPPPDGYTADDFAIPSLDELIARFPTMPLNIEIKGSGAPAIAAAQALADVLRSTGREEASVVTSFDDAVVAAFHEAAPEVELSPGLDASTAFVLGGTPLPEGMRILQLPPEYQGIPVLTPPTVAAAHAAGYVIWVWPNTDESAALYDELLAQGMDGLNANFPAEAVAAVERFAPGS